MHVGPGYILIIGFVKTNITGENIISNIMGQYPVLKTRQLFQARHLYIVYI